MPDSPTTDGPLTFAERRASRDPSVDHSSHSMQWVGGRPVPRVPCRRESEGEREPAGGNPMSAKSAVAAEVARILTDTSDRLAKTEPRALEPMLGTGRSPCELLTGWAGQVAAGTLAPDRVGPLLGHLIIRFDRVATIADALAEASKQIKAARERR